MRATWRKFAAASLPWKTSAPTLPLASCYRSSSPSSSACLPPAVSMGPLGANQHGGFWQFLYIERYAYCRRVFGVSFAWGAALRGTLVAVCLGIFPPTLPPTLLATVPATFPPTVSVFVPLSASGRGAPSRVVCKNDSGILIRHFAFKFNSLGLCSCNCKARGSGGEGTEGECSHPSVCAHMFLQREEGRPLWHFRLIWCLAPKQFSFLFCFYCLGWWWYARDYLWFTLLSQSTMPLSIWLSFCFSFAPPPFGLFLSAVRYRTGLPMAQALRGTFTVWQLAEWKNLMKML